MSEPFYYVLQAPAGCPTITTLTAAELQAWLDKLSANHEDPTFYQLENLEDGYPGNASCAELRGRDLTGLGGVIIIRGEEYRPTKKEVVTRWEV